MLSRDDYRANGCSDRIIADVKSEGEKEMLYNAAFLQENPTRKIFNRYITFLARIPAYLVRRSSCNNKITLLDIQNKMLAYKAAKPVKFLK